ncbi:MAG: hypothetical protein KBG28_05045 [Kofleriaceae bacterium]|nr:hypothetical protein [Kofleriaceae bacterium]MBP6838117.1 hypothetical protein [Kofleriaceae bacterium]MBP9203310.1 hypothetical protein [Kofleriaceae bacterium]
MRPALHDLRSPATAVALAALLAACTDFATPAQLTEPLLIAVVVEPPVVAPGGTAQLTAIGAGPDGLLAVTAPTWSLIETYPGYPPFGAVAADGRYQAPAQVPPLPDGALPIDSVQVEVDLAGRRQLAIKAVAVADLPAVNPAVTLTADGAAVTAPLQVSPGATVMLGTTVAPEAPADQTRFAWYATVGTIEAYQSSPAAWVAPAEPGPGTIIVVVRAGAGTTVATATVQVQ